VSGNIVTLTGTGTVTIEASQPGDSYFGAAFSLQRSFTVSSNTQLSTSTLTTQMSYTTTAVLPEQESTISVFPNPVRGQGMISVRTERALNGVLEVVDMQGRVVQHFSTRRFEKEQLTNIQLNTSQLSSGIYVLRLVSKEGVLTHRFQVVR
jgi:hypothetical protein